MEWQNARSFLAEDKTSFFYIRWWGPVLFCDIAGQTLQTHWKCGTFPNIQHDLPPRKLTWILKMMVSNRNLLFQGFIFRFHVSFPGCFSLRTTHYSQSIKSSLTIKERIPITISLAPRNFLQKSGNLDLAPWAPGDFGIHEPIDPSQHWNHAPCTPPILNK